MTLKELSQLYWLKKEIEYDKKRLKQLGTVDVVDVQASKLTGMPYTPPLIYDQMAEKVVTILALKEELQEALQEAIKRSRAEELKIMNYINSIDDSFIRLIFKLRFVDCKTWWQVAWGVGGNNTADSVRKCCKRYLKKMSDMSA